MVRKYINNKNNWELINNSVEGETIEMRVERMMEEGEPITDSAPLIYTEKENGVLPEYDVRTDVWDLALDAVDAGEKVRLESQLPKPVTTVGGEDNQGGVTPEPTQAN